MWAGSWANETITQTTPTWPSGVYVGGYNFTDDGPPAYTAFGKWRGSPVTHASMFGDYSSWANLQAPQGLLGHWKTSVWGANSGNHFVLATGLVPTGVAIPATANTYNSNWATFATNLKNAGFGNAIIRLGWEFNGTWYPWTVTTANTAQWIAYWQQVVTTIKTTCPGAQILWCGNRGPSGGIADPTTAYPGDGYVDLIGVDSYDQSTSVQKGGWNSQLGGTQGLNYWLGLANSHGKKFCVPEWNIFCENANGGFDDPLYISNMHGFFGTCGSALAYEATFNNASKEGLWPGTMTPQSAYMYQSLWGH